MAREVSGPARLALAAAMLPFVFLGRAADTSCPCISWKEAFTKYVTCGEFAELRTLSRPRVNLTLEEIEEYKRGPTTARRYTDVCENFLKVLDEKVCVNVDVEVWSDRVEEHVNNSNISKDTWCYVPKHCTELNGGDVIPDKKMNGVMKPSLVAAKVCKPGQDTLLREKTIDELAEMLKSLRAARSESADDALSLGTLASQAYRTLDPNAFLWAGIEPVWSAQAFARLPTTLQAAVLGKNPALVMVENGDSAHMKLIQGYKLVHLDRDDDQQCPDSLHCIRYHHREF